jgi:hypothetical protein
LTRVEGDEIQLKSKALPKIAAGEIYDVSIDFKAPNKTGSYFVVLQH